MLLHHILLCPQVFMCLVFVPLPSSLTYSNWWQAIQHPTFSLCVNPITQRSTPAVSRTPTSWRISAQALILQWLTRAGREEKCFGLLHLTFKNFLFLNTLPLKLEIKVLSLREELYLICFVMHYKHIMWQILTILEREARKPMLMQCVNTIQCILKYLLGALFTSTTERGLNCKQTYIRDKPLFLSVHQSFHYINLLYSWGLWGGWSQCQLTLTPRRQVWVFS